MFTKSHILSEIRRTAEENGGVPLGWRRFQSETGIKPTDSIGKYWARWGDALSEAGYSRNELQPRRSDEDLLGHLTQYVRELGRIPVYSELRLKSRRDPSFPSDKTLRRLGDKRLLAKKLRDHCLARDETDVVTLCDVELSKPENNERTLDERAKADDAPNLGYVYLLRSGRHYKIGRSNSVGRRERELAIQLPETSRIVHSIKTDDPVGIEAYWHGRFNDRRKNGEWFELTALDVAAFKRRKFM